MTKIKFHGWEVGAKKISFTKLLSYEAELGFKEAKMIEIAILNGESRIIEIQEKEQALQILKTAQELGFNCEIID